MSAPTKVNFKVYQGSTFSEVVRWESSTKGYAPISAITKAAPCVVTSTTHGIPKGWRFKFTDILGMTALNSSDTYHIASDVDTDTVTINTLNTLSYKDYISGGVMEYNTPVDLAGVTARMQIREKLDSTTTVAELTTENGGIVIDNINKNINIVITATDTAAFTFATGVYELELVDGATVTPFMVGNMTLVKEVTR